MSDRSRLLRLLNRMTISERGDYEGRLRGAESEPLVGKMSDVERIGLGERVIYDSRRSKEE